MFYINKKVLLLKKNTILALNLFSGRIFIPKSSNTLLININKMLSITDRNYIFFKISFIINLRFGLLLLLILV